MVDLEPRRPYRAGSEICSDLPVKLKSTDVYSCNDASTSTAGRSEASSNGSRTFLGSKSISWSRSTTCPNLSTIHRVAAEIRRDKVGDCWHELEYINMCCVSISKSPDTRESASSTHRTSAHTRGHRSDLPSRFVQITLNRRKV